MSLTRLRLKSGINPEILREYGFRTGKEWAEYGVKGVSGLGYECYTNWFYKFKMRTVDQVDLTEGKEPRVSMCFRDDGTIYCECIPEYSYHVSGAELCVITNTIFDLTKAGIIEMS